jgi:methylisocitrate lyase
VSTPGRELRRVLAAPGCAAAVGVHDPAVAKLADAAGFPVLCASGSSTAAVVAGLPDVGLVSFTEMVTHAGNLIAATERPVLCDIDTGFGGVMNVKRTIRAYEAAGAAGVLLEDQVFPKRCGQTAGAVPIPTAEMVAKIYAAKEALREGDLVIVARTDARQTEGLEGAIERSKAYLEAGADVAFPVGLPSEEEFRACSAELDAPLLTDVPEWGRAPTMTIAELGDWGWDIGVFAVSALRVALGAVREFFGELAATGTQKPWIDRMASRAEMDELMGLVRVREEERRLAELSGAPA